MAIATAPTDLRPGAWVRQAFGYRDLEDDPDRDITWHRYAGRLRLKGAWGSVVSACGQEAAALPRDAYGGAGPLRIRIEVSETVPSHACKNCLRSRS